MRQGTNNRRSRGRGGGGGRKQPGGGRFQSFDSNGPNGRLRGNASQLYEKYQTLGRDASSSDRIVAENLLQHAEHYFRVMNAAAAAAAAAGGEGQPRPRPNGGDGQPVVEPPAQPAPAPEPAPRPAPEEASEEAAPKKAAPKRKKRSGNGKAAAEASDEETAKPADGDQELAS